MRFHDPGKVYRWLEPGMGYPAAPLLEEFPGIPYVSDSTAL